MAMHVFLHYAYTCKCIVSHLKITAYTEFEKKSIKKKSRGEGGGGANKQQYQF